jgi:DNA-binding NarL/FixJ family response regulator
MLAEDHSVVRQALVNLLKTDSNISIIGEAENGKMLLELLKRDLPDLILLDIEMPVMNGYETLQIISKKFPDVYVVILSMHDNIAIMTDLISKGAKAYLSKCCDMDSLFDAIYSVKREGFYFNKSVSRALLEGYLKEKNINPIFKEISLSCREKEVLAELCEGKTNKEIACKLNITASTVDFHRGRIYKKTNSKNLAGIVKYALKHGLILD